MAQAIVDLVPNISGSSCHLRIVEIRVGCKRKKVKLSKQRDERDNGMKMGGEVMLGVGGVTSKLDIHKRV
jgi:hypothetical protein